MGSIHVLDGHIANLIAAGEVVDRPGSVVKELVENAIDAGATSVTVEIRKGGISFIRVTDNGVGMAPEDVPECIKRHATSKIQKAADLDGIATLGFRGEALAAISSVSKMRILTKQAAKAMGTVLECEGPDIIELSEAGCQNGTTIIVESLFFNTPARRKFLKKDASEGVFVTAVMERMALSRPDIGFRYISDGSIKFATPGTGKLLDAIYAVLGRDFAGKTIPVSAKEDLLELSGYIGSPENTRGNSNLQLFFINGRFVKSKTAYAAIRQAFDSYIPSERHPSCVINLTLNPRLVDVNVHPSKLEVKFANEKMIFDIIYYATRSTLSKNVQRPQMPIGRQTIQAINAFAPVSDTHKSLERAQVTMNELQLPEEKSVEVREEELPPPPGPRPAERYVPLNLMQPSALQEELPPPPPEDFSWDKLDLPRKADNVDDALLPLPDYKLIGEAFYSYIIVELGDKLIFIDKHAAHERILFEEMKRNMQKSKIESQVLLTPIEIPLDSLAFDALSEYADDVRKTGLELTLNEQTMTASISCVPMIIEGEDIAAFLQSLAGLLADSATTVGVSREMLYEKALYQASCKAAIKAGRVYDQSYLRWICDRLLVLPNIKYCPHGRPVAFEITKYELAKQFKRI